MPDSPCVKYTIPTFISRETLYLSRELLEDKTLMEEIVDSLLKHADEKGIVVLPAKYRVVST